MKADTRAMELHDKATRGESLANAEQAYLEQWYALQDQEESTLLACGALPQLLSELQAQVTKALAQLPVVTQRLQALAAANDMLRQEIATYKQKLAQAPTGQMA